MSKTHIAIMKKSWGLLEKIILGEKTIESRWYKYKYKPWNEIEAEDLVYFKNSGENVKVKSKVAKVLRYHDLTPEKVKWILEVYGQRDGIEKRNLNKYFELFQNKKYCLLIFLKDIKKVRPFKISKKGFGAMAAWLVVDDIKKIKK